VINGVLHHIGVAVAALAPAIQVHERLYGQRLVSGPFQDPLQKVAVCFLAREGEPLLELVAPLGSDSPISAQLQRGIGAYHLCYEVADLEVSLAEAEAERCLVVAPPAPAVAFEGRRIAWFFAPTRQLTELLERAPKHSL
jgi:methylmalonyl-CoA/ethylmalonyl-CoA epimerase